MADDRIRRLLEEELATVPLVAPAPQQARYSGLGSASGGAFGQWARLAGAFAAGAVATALLLSAGTGSANPRVWTIRVESALSQLGQPATPTASPSPSSTATPTAPPADNEGTEGGAPAAVAPSGGEREGSGSGETAAPEPTAEPAAEPTATPDGGGSDGGGGTDGGGGSDGSGGTDGGGQAAPTPAPTD